MGCAARKVRRPDDEVNSTGGQGLKLRSHRSNKMHCTMPSRATKAHIRSLSCHWSSFPKSNGKRHPRRSRTGRQFKRIAIIREKYWTLLLNSLWPSGHNSAWSRRPVNVNVLRKQRHNTRRPKKRKSSGKLHHLASPSYSAPSRWISSCACAK